LYLDLLGRAADSAGLAAWTAQIDSGAISRGGVAYDFEHSTEYCGNVATKLYTQYLHRAIDSGGLANFSGLLCGGMTAQAVSVALISSGEYSTLNASNTAFVTALYQDALGRASDSGGLASWVAVLNAGASRNSVAIGFVYGAEYAGNTVKADYLTVLRRAADSTSLANWTAAIVTGHMSDESVLSQFYGSGEYLTWATTH
jgi:hypothetical protein